MRETREVASVLIRCTLAIFPFLHHNLPLNKTIIMRETREVASVLIRCTRAIFPFLHHNLPLTWKDREWTWLQMIRTEGSKTWCSHCYKLDFAAANFHIVWICHISFHTERNLPPAGVSGRKGLQFRHSLPTERSQSQKKKKKERKKERKKEKKRTRLE